MFQSTKAKLPKIIEKERMKVAFSTAINGLLTVVQIVKSMTDGVGLGLPGLHPGLNGLLRVLNAIQLILNN